MKKEELEAIFGPGAKNFDMGSIDDYLTILSLEGRLPKFSLAVCTLRIEESAPPLLKLLERAAAGEVLSIPEQNLFFRGLFVLGAARVGTGWQPLLQLLRRPEAELEDRLGDALTESLPSIAAGLFVDDTDSLFEAIADPSIHESAREALFGAATYLVWDGRIERERMQRFLVHFFEHRLAERWNMAWIGWLRGISLLGLRDLAPLAHQAWDEGHIVPDYLERDEFEDELAQAEQNPADQARFEPYKLGYIDDVSEALRWTDHDDRDVADDEASFAKGWLPGEPVRNPLRNVGRNDPCPCGSGKKAKKCCLARPE
jgi:hypothetical protein